MCGVVDLDVTGSALGREAAAAPIEARPACKPGCLNLDQRRCGCDADGVSSIAGVGLPCVGSGGEASNPLSPVRRT